MPAGLHAALTIADQCVDRAEALAARLRATGGAARVTNIDLTQEASVQGVVRNTVQQFGRLDILVKTGSDCFIHERIQTKETGL